MGFFDRFKRRRATLRVEPIVPLTIAPGARLAVRVRLTADGGDVAVSALRVKFYRQSMRDDVEGPDRFEHEGSPVSVRFATPDLVVRAGETVEHEVELVVPEDALREDVPITRQLHRIEVAVENDATATADADIRVTPDDEDDEGNDDDEGDDDDDDDDDDGEGDRVAPAMTPDTHPHALDSWLERFRAMVEALRSDPRVEVLRFDTYPPVDEARLDAWQAKLGHPLGEDVRAFYRQTDGLALAWQPRGHATRSDVADWRLDDYGHPEGHVKILPIDLLFAEPLPTFEHREDATISFRDVEHDMDALRGRTFVLDPYLFSESALLVLGEPDGAWILRGADHEADLESCRPVDFGSYLELVLAVRGARFRDRVHAQESRCALITPRSSPGLPARDSGSRPGTLAELIMTPISSWPLRYGTAVATLAALAACGDDATGPTTTTPTCTLECATPPPATCADPSTLRVFSSDGRCEDDACSYPHVDLPCALGCADGACLGDPCAGVTCTTPPDGCHVDQGVCQSGVCTYALADGKACDDGDTCTDDDRCAAGSCAGEAIACTTPPAATCADANNLLAYVASGTCDAGGCTYESRTVPCPDGCVDGACLGDPCAGVVCNSPPGPCHESTGTCSNGICQYAFDDGAACDDGDACTTGDKCQAGTCGGAAVACVTPPAAACADGDTLIVADATGTCDGGACAYDTREVACNFGCADNGCVGDPCAGVTCNTPAAATCLDANTLSTPAATGTCQGGTCDYPRTTTTCPYGCAAGKCTAPVGYVISEVLYDSEGFPDSDAFVELHGPANAPLTGVTLVGVNGNGGGDYATIALSGTFDASGLFVVAHPDAAPGIAAFADVTSGAVDFQNGPDTIQLRYGATVLDALAYGDFSAEDVQRGEGDPHPGAAAGESLARDKDFHDTNDNAADFIAAVITPGVGPRTCEDLCAIPDATQCDGAATVVTCDDGDGDGCLEWTAPDACDDGRHCDGGGCVCDVGCGTLGATECTGGEVRTCVSVGGCPVWSASQACESGTCADDEACFEAPDLVITQDRELCGVQVVDELIVQGGAKVTCSSGELRVHARTIFVDPASMIDLSATSAEASGGGYGFCADGHLNQAATGGGGGGNGTKGQTAASVTWEKEVWEPGCSGGIQCYDTFCVECTGGNGGGARGSATNLELSSGGRGGNGCYDWTQASPGSYFHACDPNEPEPPGGKGGGALELVADESITILGKLRAKGQDGQPSTAGSSPMTGSGGGAGGTIVLRAPTVSVPGIIETNGGYGLAVGTKNEGCGNEQVAGANGGDGRLKLVYSESYDLSGGVSGAVQSVSYMPPTEFAIAVDGEDAPAGPVVVNDSFTSITFRWVRPFADATGFWYRLSQDPAGAVSAANGTYTTETEVTIPRASFTATGVWYLHVISVHGPSVTLGTISDRASLTVNNASPTISSQSHPNPSAWVPGTTLVAEWTSPTGVDADFPRYHYRLDRDSQSTYATTGWTATTGRNVLLTKDADGNAIDGFAYYLHVVAEDRFGHVGTKVSHYRVQIGAEPATTTFYGYVHDQNGDPLVGATLRLEPFARVQTTQVAGYFIFEGLYVGGYTAHVTPAGGSGGFVVEDVTVTPAASPLTIAP